jgi:hypothetical protein
MLMVTAHHQRFQFGCLTNYEVLKKAFKRVQMLFLCGSTLKEYDRNKLIVKVSEVVSFKFLLKCIFFQHHTSCLMLLVMSASSFISDSELHRTM